MSIINKSAIPEAVTEPNSQPDYIGRFRIERLLGTGSMGTVYLAEDPVIHRQVAIKTLNLNVTAQEARLFEETFLNEARSAGKLNHPHIVTVYDAGRINGVSYIAMEHLQGIELRQVIARGDRLPVRQVCDIFIRIADAIHYAHQQGIIHRDIKPANIFLIGKNNPKVLDFGIAQAIKSYSQSIMVGPLDSCLAGTPNYMSPESLQGKPLDGRSDIFSLGVVMYETLTGVVPFQGTSFETLKQKILESHPLPPQQMNAKIGLVLARILAKALAKNPAERYQTAKEFADDLRKYVKQERTRNLVSSALENHEKQVEHSRRKMIGSSLVLACLASITAVLFYDRWYSSSPVVASPAPVVASPAPVVASPAPVAAATEPDNQANTPSTATVSRPVILPDTTVADTSTPVSSNPPVKKAVSDETREQDKKVIAKTTGKPVPAVPTTIATGSINLAISPWGEVFVDGSSRGISPPLSTLTLPVGSHRVIIRNGEAEFSASIEVKADEPVRLRHRF